MKKYGLNFLGGVVVSVCALPEWTLLPCSCPRPPSGLCLAALLLGLLFPLCQRRLQLARPQGLRAQEEEKWGEMGKCEPNWPEGVNSMWGKGPTARGGTREMGGIPIPYSPPPIWNCRRWGVHKVGGMFLPCKNDYDIITVKKNNFLDPHPSSLSGGVHIRGGTANVGKRELGRETKRRNGGKSGRLKLCRFLAF